MKPFPKQVWLKYSLRYREGPSKEEHWENLGIVQDQSMVDRSVADVRAEVAMQNSWNEGYRGITCELFDELPLPVLEKMLTVAKAKEEAARREVAYFEARIAQTKKGETSD